MAISLGAAMLGSAALSAAGSFASNSMSVYKAKKLAEYQAALNYRYSKKSSINSPTWNRRGFEKAGFNPMLATGSLGQVESSWTNGGDSSTPDLSHIGPNAISNALAVKQQGNQDALTSAQVDNYNADSVLKNNQSITEMYTQLEKINHSDLMQAQKILTDKEATYTEKRTAWEQAKTAKEIEKMGNDMKVDMMNAMTNQVNATSNRINANSNAQSVKQNAPIAKQEAIIRKWNARHPVASRLLPGTASSAIGAFLK